VPFTVQMSEKVEPTVMLFLAVAGGGICMGRGLLGLSSTVVPSNMSGQMMFVFGSPGSVPWLPTGLNTM